MPNVTQFSNRNSIVLASYDDFFQAIETGNIQTIDALYFTDEYFTHRNMANLNALHIAVLQSNSVLICWLLEQGANPNLADDLGYTPLHLSVIMNQMEIVKILLASDQIEIDKKNRFEETPMKLAVKLGYYRIANLIEYKVNLLVAETLILISTKIFTHDQQEVFSDFTHTSSSSSSTYIPDNPLNNQMQLLKNTLPEKDDKRMSLQETLHSKQLHPSQHKNVCIKANEGRFFHQKPVNIDDASYIPQLRPNIASTHFQ